MLMSLFYYIFKTTFTYQWPLKKNHKDEQDSLKQRFGYFFVSFKMYYVIHSQERRVYRANMYYF